MRKRKRHGPDPPRISPERERFLRWLGAHPVVPLVAILLLAALVRTGALLDWLESVYRDFLVFDESVYHLWAVRVAQGGDATFPVTDFAALPAYFMLAAYRLFSPQPLVVRILNLLLGVATCGGIYLIGRRLADDRTGLLAAAVAALYKPFIFYSVTLLKEALGLLLFWGIRGWFNLFLTQFVPFVTGPLRVNYTIPGLTLFYVWLYFPYTCVTTMSALESLDQSIEEAGAVVGANRWQVLRYIVLPLITPGILAGSVLTFMAAFGAFSVPLIAGGDYRPLAVEIYKEISIPIPGRWSGASAIAIIMGLLQVGFLTLYMRFVRRAGGAGGAG